MAGKKKRGRNRSKQGRPNRSSAPVPVRGFDTAIERAQRALEQNRAHDALNLAEIGLTFINPARNPQAAGVINQLLAEAHFRLGVEALDPQEQETHLNAALKLDPKDARIHFHLAVALLRQSRLAEAAAALDKAADHPGAAYVRSLIQLAKNQPWPETGLAPEEINTLRLLQTIHAGLGEKTLHGFAQPPLLASNELWQALLAQRSNPSAVTPERLVALAQPLPSPQAQGILHYYAGISALDQGHNQETRRLWTVCVQKGLRSPWFQENLLFLGRESLIAEAQAENWQAIVDRADQFPNSANEDRILSETAGTAYFTLGYQAAQAGKWQKAAELLREASKFTGGRTLAQNLALCEEALENWDAAGDAWREMARRRPRSEKHPDYMTDAQVAALWAHAAECYDHSEYPNEEVVNCLRTAVKYAENDLALRMRLAEALMQADRMDAAENELGRILEIDGNHIPALLHLAHAAGERWHRDAGPLFKRVLAIEPTNQEARDGLAKYHLTQVKFMSQTQSLLGRLTGKGSNETTEYLEGALMDLPGHPQILLSLAAEYRQLGIVEEATAALLEACHANPEDTETGGVAMHELLHLGEMAELERMIADYREHPRLLMPFWVNQGEKVLNCKLDTAWAMRFFEEALLLAEKKRSKDSRAIALLQILDIANEYEAADLAADFLNRVKVEMPHSGILEYAEARTLFGKTPDDKRVQRLLRKAAQLAAKAGDQAVIEQIEITQKIVSRRLNPFEDILGGLNDDLVKKLLETFERTFDDSDFF